MATAISIQRTMGALAVLLAAAPALAAAQQVETAAAKAAPRVQSPDESLAQDAAEYARANGVGQQEAVRRLRAQEASVAATDRLQRVYRDRLAGLSIEHTPVYRIVVLLTGDAPVAGQWLVAGGKAVPVVFRTGASATRDEIIAALRRNHGEIERIVPSSAGMGLDSRTGELVVMAGGFGDGDRLDREGELSALTGVPVRIRDVELPSDFSIGGGARVFGEAEGRRQACTTGFVVADATRTGIATAAHCPDTLYYRDEQAGDVTLRFVGQWGVGFQDVQINVSDLPLSPVFHLDDAKSVARAPTAMRRRTSARAGDAVCHRGVYSGYSCSQVELTDYAPAGALCGGRCDPAWTTVAGPSCRHGDSGGPVFSGTVAFGIVKGGSYRGGRCSFYFYMSTDYLPEGWSLLRGDGAPVPASGPGR